MAFTAIPLYDAPVAGTVVDWHSDSNIGPQHIAALDTKVKPHACKLTPPSLISTSGILGAVPFDEPQALRIKGVRDVNSCTEKGITIAQKI